MANKVLYGLRNVYYSVITESAGTITYGTPKQMSAEGAGAISVSLAPVGENNDKYADDVIWFSQTANQGYEGDLVLTNVGDSFKKDIMGMIEDTKGSLIESADAVFKNFALAFEVQGNEKATRTWYYYCSVARPSDEAATKEATITPADKTLTLKSMPRPTDKKVKITHTDKSTSSSPDTTYTGWFTEVQEEQD